MRAPIALIAAACLSGASTGAAQVKSGKPPWADTARESSVYPIGEAVPVYRAVLDFLYHDGNRQPTVIIMRDTVERHALGACPVARCAGSPKWAHKSKIDTATIIAYSRLSPKQPGLRDFGYSIPIVLISNDDVNRMNADGTELLAQHPELRDPNGYGGAIWGFWAELRRMYPGAWGVTTISKVGFNGPQSEALINVYQWCGAGCHSNEILFLKKSAGRWRVVERIPVDIQIDQPDFILRYVGPAGQQPSESEIVPDSRSGIPSETASRDAVYRAVLDSLYSFQGERPGTIVLTDFFRGPWDPHKTLNVDAELARKFEVLRRIRAPLDTRPSYRIPILILSKDSLASLTKNGVAIDTLQTGAPLDVALAKQYPGAWGIVSMSRVAFNADRTSAMLYTYHTCGGNCHNGDTWLLQRTAKGWHVSDRVTSLSEPDLQIEPLRYLGLDVDPNAYRKRRVQGVVVNDSTGKPISFLDINLRRTLNTGRTVSQPSIRTDSAGRYTLINPPLNANIELLVPCRGSARNAWAQPISVMPGLDTTINMRIDFAVCDTTAVVEQSPPRPNLVAGAEAFVWRDSARFVFPRQPSNAYVWDVPLKGLGEGSAEYVWEVEWEIPEKSAGHVPQSLSLIKDWRPGGPHFGSLGQLIAGVPLWAMVECLSCDGAVYDDPKTDHSKVFATVENDELVFVIRGAKAVRRIFPKIPATVTFRQSVWHVPHGEYGPGDQTSTQEVLVNCRNADASPENGHRCDMKN